MLKFQQIHLLLLCVTIITLKNKKNNHDNNLNWKHQKINLNMIGKRYWEQLLYIKGKPEEKSFLLLTENH